MPWVMKGDVLKPVLERFEEKVERVTESGCWLWVGGLSTTGYGRFYDPTRTPQDGYAHRWAYEHWKGPIQKGLTLDHLCRVPCCVNPAHLEAVTLAVNIRRGESVSAKNRRKTRCKYGHAFSPPIQRRDGRGRPYMYRRCVSCDRRRNGYKGIA